MKPGTRTLGDMLRDVFRRLRSSLAAQDDAEQKLDEATVRTLLQCMALVANADGVSQEEIETIASVYQKLTGRAIMTSHVLDVVVNISAAGSDPVAFVAAAGVQVPEKARLTIARACYMVMTADGTISKEEDQLFDRLLGALRVRRSDVAELPQYPPS